MNKTYSLKYAARNCGAIALMVVIALAVAHRVDSAPRRGPYKRVKPNPNDKAAADVFFPNVFQDGLKGERPANLSSGGATRPSVGSPTTGGGDTPSPMGGEGVYAWSKLISAATIEDEIKRISREVEQDVTTPTAFNGLGHKKCRMNFSLLGMLFAIAGEYDADVRWKEEAPAARDLFARAGRNCKVGTPASYNESKLRKQDLADMVAGSRLQADAGPAAADWSQTCERSQVMKRIEKSNKRLRELTASTAEFKSGGDDVKHEAEMMVAMAEVLQKEEMPDGVDDDYKAFCQTLKKAAQEIVEAQKLGGVEPATKAMGVINRSCDDCHEVYRG